MSLRWFFGGCSDAVGVIERLGLLKARRRSVIRISQRLIMELCKPEDQSQLYDLRRFLGLGREYEAFRIVWNTGLSALACCILRIFALKTRLVQIISIFNDSEQAE